MAEDIRLGQLDEVSRMLGKMEGVVEGLSEYIHQFRHDENNRRQIDQGFQEKVLRNIEKIRTDMEALREKDALDLAARLLAAKLEMDKVKADVELLKAVNIRRDGVFGIVDWLLKSPIVGWVAAAATAIWLQATGRLDL
ncbi:MAG: hypothetical protein ACSLE1_01965 [Sphingobium sp.]